MTLAVYLLPERECSKCQPAQKKQWGCDEDISYPVLIDDENVFRCPRRPFLDTPDWFNAIFSSSSYMEKGMLTEVGTWLDQPAKLTQALTVVSKAERDATEYKAKADERRKSAQARAAAAAPPPRRAGPNR